MEAGYPIDFYSKTKEAFLNYLYEGSEIQYETVVAKLIQTNVDLRNGLTNGCFMYYYRGEYYFNDVLTDKAKQFAIIKHDYETIEIYPELQEELHIAIQNLLDLKLEMKPVEIYINNALGICETLDDVKELFPKKMGEVIPFMQPWRGVPYLLPQKKITLTPKVINQHLIDFKDLRGRMNARIVMNQLFNKV